MRIKIKEKLCKKLTITSLVVVVTDTKKSEAYSSQSEELKSGAKYKNGVAVKLEKNLNKRL